MRVPAAFLARDYACVTHSLSDAMFAKRTKHSSGRPPTTDHGSQTEQSGSESRGDAIARLEEELEEQRAEAQLLRQELDATAFKTETLEKSYAKQLAEVRDKLATAQSDLKIKEEILSGLGGPHEHTLRELSDALAVIKALKKQLDKMRKQNEQGGGGHKQRTDKTTKARELLGNDAYGLMPAEINESRAAPRTSSGVDAHASGAYARASSDDDTSDGTINSLIENDGWAQRKPRIGTGQATATVEAPPPETSKVEMLSPDLVFTDNDKDKDDER